MFLFSHTHIISILPSSTSPTRAGHVLELISLSTHQNHLKSVVWHMRLLCCAFCGSDRWVIVISCVFHCREILCSACAHPVLPSQPPHCFKHTARVSSMDPGINLEGHTLIFPFVDEEVEVQRDEDTWEVENSLALRAHSSSIHCIVFKYLKVVKFYL